MKDRSYLLTIAVGNDAVDLDEEVRRAVGWMSENIDEDGQHAVRITVHNYDTSQPVTEHEYIPEPVDEERERDQRAADFLRDVFDGQ